MAGQDVPGMAGWTFAEEPTMSSPEPKSDIMSALKLAAIGKAMSVGGKVVDAVTDTASRLRVSPAVAMDQFSLNQPQKILKGVSLAGSNPLRPESALATIAKRIAPYAQTISTLAGAQGVNDLAQIAEPERKDIGFLGLGASMSDLDILKANVAKGANPASTAAALAKGDPKKFGALLTAYMQSRQVK